ncbi:germination protease [Paenibacillus konkukensis]|uniref:Germination protease n=1 Tax=Paenibacillus konkukensis TaxID=2020716 RepID=A0ABY4RQR3_9BACL|nr:spore protease YyaC [Paenibacillus konkukensis]UQZ84503.1 germination protease [Paenibacillus konkukensis]
MKLPFHRDAVNAAESPEAAPALKIPHTESNIIEILSGKLSTILDQVPSDQPIIIICVGTDRSTGDSLGPLVGTQLKKFRLDGIHLYGTLDHPVHAMNLKDTLQTIQEQFSDPFIIAIDACLGQLTSVGCIQIGSGPVKPGAGVNKDLPPVGDMHITGIVNVGGFMEYFVLQNTRLSLVMSMAEVIAKSFEAAVTHSMTASTSFARLDG